MLWRPSLARSQKEIMSSADTVRYSSVAGLEGLDVMSARWVKHSFRPHVHDFYAVSLNYGGSGAFHYRGVLREAVPWTCNLIEPGESHTGQAMTEDGWSYRNLYLGSSLMESLLQAADWRGAHNVRFKSPLVKDGVLARRLANFFTSTDESASLLRSESELLSVMARLTTVHLAQGQCLSQVGTEHKAVRRVREWLDNHSEQNVSLRFLAGLADLSPYYLVRAFHKQVGVPPHQYQTNIRVLRARRLLRSGTPISEVAITSGFCDQSHLNRCFKSTLGTTPGRYVNGS
jgi:AraC-like DNA-binding protein